MKQAHPSNIMLRRLVDDAVFASKEMNAGHPYPPASRSSPKCGGPALGKFLKINAKSN
jgi:hypothetical protein